MKIIIFYYLMLLNNHMNLIEAKYQLNLFIKIFIFFFLKGFSLLDYYDSVKYESF